jgi:hypothetical protein
MFFRNTGKLLPNYGALHARTQYIPWRDNIKVCGYQVGYEDGNLLIWLRMEHVDLVNAVINVWVP